MEADKRLRTKRRGLPLSDTAVGRVGRSSKTRPSLGWRRVGLTQQQAASWEWQSPMRDSYTGEGGGGLQCSCGPQHPQRERRGVVKTVAALSRDC